MKHGQQKIHASRLGCLRHLFGAGLLALGLAAAMIGPTPVAAKDEAPTIAVLPFEIEDTSGEVGPPDRHDAMLKGVTRAVSDKIEAKGLYRVVPADKVANAIAEVDPGTALRGCNGCEFDIAKIAGGDFVMIGWFYKVSTLVGTLHIIVKDVATGGTVYAHVFDFRGDNEEAWQRAADYMIRSLAKRTRQAETTN